MLPPVTVELHETAYMAYGSTSFTLSVIFSNRGDNGGQGGPTGLRGEQLAATL
jgi:hypothetical protein